MDHSTVDCLLKEVGYITSRSSGPGGQHVNKTETKVELHWEPGASACLDAQQKALVISRYGFRLTGKGMLVLPSDRFRSQHRNRAEVTERFIKLVQSALVVQPKRIATRPTKSSREKRIRSKKIRGEMKRLRKPPSKNDTGHG
jgi:ribosome-associated protein